MVSQALRYVVLCPPGDTWWLALTVDGTSTGKTVQLKFQTVFAIAALWCCDGLSKAGLRGYSLVVQLLIVP